MANSRSGGGYGNTERKNISEYEQSREERIKENRERMQKLGIIDLSLQFKAHKPSTATRSRKPPPSRSTPLNPSPLPCPGPVRRSSRLQSVTPVSYSEALFTKNDKSLSSEVHLLRLREEGTKPEFYTEEHDKLLGSTEMEWTLFIDGVGKDGKRIYDPVKGKTCHQCRQKTLGLRTHCSNCKMVQGQFCGDCLYMRYGENVIEANQNPNWICPVCRGICNCSLCRQAKGWPPTGSLYRKVTSLGYKSVAHFLIQTQRLKTATETETDSKNRVPVSAKRSLAFTFSEETSTETVGTLTCDKQDEKSYFSDGGDDGESKREEKTNLSDKEQGDCMTVEEKTQLFLDTEQGQLDTGMMKLDVNDGHGSREKETDILVDKQYDCENVPGEANGFVGKAGLSISSQEQNGTFQIELAIDKVNCENQDKTASDIGNSKIDCTLAPESSPVSKKKHVQTIETTGDSLAGRLRVRRNRDNEEDTLMPQCGADNPNSSSQTTVSDNNISKRQRKRHNENQVQETNKFSSSSAKVETTKDIQSLVAAAITSSKSKRKPNHSSEQPPCPDSIAGRLRQRRVQIGDA